MPLYFAYGSNLCPQQMQKRCADARFVTIAALKDHRLCFPRISRTWGGGGVAGILAHAGATCFGVVYELTEDDLAAMDGYEGHPHDYFRAEINVAPPEGESFACWSYFANPQEGAPFLPVAAYLERMVSGAEAHGLPQEYIDALKAQKILAKHEEV